MKFASSSAILQLGHTANSLLSPQPRRQRLLPWGAIQNCSVFRSAISRNRQAAFFRIRSSPKSPPVLVAGHEAALPNATLAQLASRSVCWWPPAPCCQNPENRITPAQQADSPFNTWPTISKPTTGWLPWLDTLQAVKRPPRTPVGQKKAWIPSPWRGAAGVMGYACGTCRMGSDPRHLRGGASTAVVTKWAT